MVTFDRLVMSRMAPTRRLRQRSLRMALSGHASMPGHPLLPPNAAELSEVNQPWRAAATAAPIWSCTRSISAAFSYFRRGQKKPRSPSFLRRGTM